MRARVCVFFVVIPESCRVAGGRCPRCPRSAGECRKGRSCKQESVVPWDAEQDGPADKEVYTGEYRYISPADEEIL